MSKNQSVAVSYTDRATPKAIITVEAPVFTLINVFDVARERQSELVEFLEKATDEVMRHFPGFISASIHRGLDGIHVAGYVQWRSKEDFERMFADPKAQAHIREATSIGKHAPFHYRVSSVHLSPK